jgi:hypothetical protein
MTHSPFTLGYLLGPALLLAIAALTAGGTAGRSWHGSLRSRLRQPVALIPSPRSAVASSETARPVRLVFVPYERLLVVHSSDDELVLVLCPPDQDPAGILDVAAVVLPEREYAALTRYLHCAAMGLSHRPRWTGPSGRPRVRARSWH